MKRKWIVAFGRFVHGAAARLGPTATQLAGGAAAVTGLYLLVGLGWTLLAGGLTVAAVSILIESRSSR